jgi:hypothetical protein
MDQKRIVLGGLGAALVMMVGEFAIEPAMSSTTQRFFSRLGLPVPGESAMVGLALTLLVLGYITVCLYAEFSIRSGAGVKTAALTGVLVWVLSCMLPNITLYTFGVVDTEFFLFASAWPLVETVAAAVAGAAIHDGRRVRGVAPTSS